MAKNDKDELVEDLTQVVLQHHSQLHRIESMLNLRNEIDVSATTLRALDFIHEYHLKLPILLQKKLGINLKQALQVTDELEDLGYINRTPFVPDEDEPLDDMFLNACTFLLTEETCSASSIQRQFSIGYNKASRIIEQLYSKGFIGEINESENRRVYRDKIDEFLNSDLTRIAPRNSRSN
ncbi:MAG: DNA translocase FtsK [Patescibacteria group bacterium]